MNKLEGFYELKRLEIPSVPWKEYSPNIHFDPDILWTIRVAIDQGDDFDLPRAVGVKADIAKIKADEFYNKFGKIGIVVYYPFFNAIKSGVIEIRFEKYIIESVDKDLWNLATEGRRDETIIIGSTITRDGKIGFVSDKELNELVYSIEKIKNKFRNYLAEGKSIYLEWSFAQNVDKNGNGIGDGYLVFYECKAI